MIALLAARLELLLRNRASTQTVLRSQIVNEGYKRESTIPCRVCQTRMSRFGSPTCDREYCYEQFCKRESFLDNRKCYCGKCGEGFVEYDLGGEG